jgi:hypothetical protein
MSIAMKKTSTPTSTPSRTNPLNPNTRSSAKPIKPPKIGNSKAARASLTPIKQSLTKHPEKQKLKTFYEWGQHIAKRPPNY